METANLTFRTKQYSTSYSNLRLQLHGAIYRPDSLVLMLRYCANLKAIRYESTSLKRIVADKSHRVIVALSVTANDSITISFLNHNTIALVRNCLKSLSCVVIETALDGMKKNQLS